MKLSKELLGDFCPNEQTVTEYQKRWEKFQDGKYYENDKALYGLVKLQNGHDAFEEILPKSVLLNELYSTRVKYLRNVVKDMTEIDGLGKAIANGDISVVDRIAACGSGNKYISFASKYCCMHNPNAFPIYDSIVKKVLKILKTRDGFTTVRNFDCYKNYKQAYDDLKKHYNLTKFTYREIDKCLWVCGKEKLVEK